MKKYTYEIPTFAEYGLDIDCNFIEAPKCPCGHDEIGALAILETDNQLFDFMGSVVNSNECEKCAMFAKKLDGTMHAIVKFEGGIQSLKSKKNKKEDFKRMVDIVQLHQYGLIVEVEPGCWHVVEK